ncbi:MAG: zinc ribbon domain-containing protein [Methylococcales bacterium]|nr:zinc ribbon domain-containing protein [Methylococcales bacterium]
MNCPKCQAELQNSPEICPQCGIVFKKYFKYHPEQMPLASVQRPTITIFQQPEDLAAKLLLQEAQKTPLLFVWGRLLILVGLVIWSWRLIAPTIASNAVGESFLHLVNLPFHEAGHIFFRPFGAFITSLGGSLGQLLVPTICAATLLFKTRDPFGAAVAVWWLGENCLDIAPYMDDARAGQLPLLGGNFGHSAPYGFHDWQYLLTESGLLQYDHTLAKAIFFIGSVIMLLAMLWGGMVLRRQLRA